jgi:hypothetical protein
VTGRRLIFHPGVEGDLAAILDYYESRDPALPARFRSRLPPYDPRDVDPLTDPTCASPGRQVSVGSAREVVAPWPELKVDQMSESLEQKELDPVSRTRWV